MAVQPQFLGDWAGDDDLKVLRAFEVSDERVFTEYLGATMLLAWYSYESYSGSAFVLYERGGKLFEVDGSHCSCNGLEHQWDPEETTVEALVHRMEKGDLGTDYGDGNTFRRELLQVLRAYITEGT